MNNIIKMLLFAATCVLSVACSAVPTQNSALSQPFSTIKHQSGNPDSIDSAPAPAEMCFGKKGTVLRACVQHLLDQSIAQAKVEKANG